MLCRLATGTSWAGAAPWRWLMFFAVWPLLRWAGIALAWLLASLILAVPYTATSGLCLPLMMEQAVARVIRASGWIFVWLVLMHDPRQWARKADAWSSAAAVPVWTDHFHTVHHYMIRALIAYLLAEVVAWIRAVVMGHIVVRTHQQKFRLFHSLKVAVMLEKCIRALVKQCMESPESAEDSSPLQQMNLALTSGDRAPWDGETIAHWEAVKFLTFFKDRVLRFAPEQRDDTRKEVEDLQSRALTVRKQLAGVVAKRIQANVRQVESVPRRNESAQPGGEKRREVTADDVLEAATAYKKYFDEVVDGAAARPIVHAQDSQAQGSGQAAGMDQLDRHTLDNQGEENASFSHVPGDDEVVKTTTEEFMKLEGWKCSRPFIRGWVASQWSPQKLADEMTSRHNQVTPRSWFLVGVLTKYMLDHQHILVPLHPSKETPVTRRRDAKNIGYLMFFILKDEKRVARHTLIKSEVDRRRPTEDQGSNGVAEEKDQSTSYLWRLLDRDGDNAAFLSEMMDAIESMRIQRADLIKILKGDVKIVRELAFAIGLVLSLLWAFAAAALFVPEVMFRVWTALSGALLGFSFIFKDTICEVFQNAVYIFAVQPFHPTDAITVDDTRYTIEEVGLLSTQLQRSDGAIIIVATAAMRTKEVHNVTRSGRLRDELQFTVPHNTCGHKLRGIAHFVRARIREQSTLFHGAFTVRWAAAPGDDLTLSVTFDHKTNGLDVETTLTAKTYLYVAVIDAFKILDIKPSSKSEPKDGVNMPESAKQGQTASADVSDMAMAGYQHVSDMTGI